MLYFCLSLIMYVLITTYIFFFLHHISIVHLTFTQQPMPTRLIALSFCSLQSNTSVPTMPWLFTSCFMSFPLLLSQCQHIGRGFFPDKNSKAHTDRERTQSQSITKWTGIPLETAAISAQVPFISCGVLAAWLPTTYVIVRAGLNESAVISPINLHTSGKSVKSWHSEFIEKTQICATPISTAAASALLSRCSDRQLACTGLFGVARIHYLFAIQIVSGVCGTIT